MDQYLIQQLKEDYMNDDIDMSEVRIRCEDLFTNTKDKLLWIRRIQDEKEDLENEDNFLTVSN